MKGHVEAAIGIIRNLPSLDYVIPAVIGTMSGMTARATQGESREKIYRSPQEFSALRIPLTL